MGGLWEDDVKLVKRHLFATIKSTRAMTYEELNSLFIRIEGTVNFRPLCPLTDDPNDLLVLTPNYFLFDRSGANLPYPDIESPAESIRVSFKAIQKCTQLFWKKMVYRLSTLASNSSKWQKEKRISSSEILFS